MFSALKRNSEIIDFNFYFKWVYLKDIYWLQLLFDNSDPSLSEGQYLHFIPELLFIWVNLIFSKNQTVKDEGFYVGYLKVVAFSQLL